MCVGLSCAPVTSGRERPGELIVRPQLMQGRKLRFLTAKNGSPTEGQEFCGVEAEGEFIKALLVLMAQCWLGTEIVLTGGNSRKALVAFAVGVDEYSLG